MRPELVEQAKRGDIRGASPRKEEILFWQVVFWLALFLASAFFGTLAIWQIVPVKSLLSGVFIVVGAWLTGHGLGKLCVKKHIEHPANNLIFKVDDNNVNRRESDITGTEIFAFVVIGLAMFGVSLWFLIRLSVTPVHSLALGLYAGLLILIAETCLYYKREIRTRLLDIMFKAQTMYAITEHIKFNPPVTEGESISGDDEFAEMYRKELARQYEG